jgi:hypothetical protein
MLAITVNDIYEHELRMVEIMAVVGYRCTFAEKT